MLKRRAVQELHGDECLAILFINLVNCADVGMVQSGSGFGLTLETAESLGIFSYIVREELQGNEAAARSTPHRQLG